MYAGGNSAAGHLMYLRQLALAASTLEPIRAQLFQLLGITSDYQDPGVGEFGLENSVMVLGNTFLEIVAPDPKLAIAKETAVARTLHKAGHEQCGYMALLQVDDFRAFDAHISDLGVTKIWQAERDDVSACHVHPKDIGGAIVSFDEMRPPEAWVWAGTDWITRPASLVGNIRGLGIESPQPQVLAASWQRVTGGKASIEDGLHRIDFDQDTFVTFAEGDWEGITEFVIQSDNVSQLEKNAHDIGLVWNQGVELGSLALRFVA
jgi:hypothetical protein